ncbi:hypothetical protein H0X06_01105, partial [Candidatus Dependentiae bacterium]|nr:hypothetical protein [Candidatus Dependentiae bacterium]
MKRYIKKVGISIAVVGTLVAAYDLYYWNHKKVVFKKVLKEHKEKVSAHPELLKFTSLDKETVLPELGIQGEIPSWLEGTL